MRACFYVHRMIFMRTGVTLIWSAVQEAGRERSWAEHQWDGVKPRNTEDRWWKPEHKVGET